MVFDDDRQSKTAITKIKNSFYSDHEDGVGEKVYILEGCEGIEDMFSVGDLRLVDSSVEFPQGTKKSEKIKNEYGGKELFSRLFLEKVHNGEITKEKLSSGAKSKFENAFKFIEEKLIK